MKTTTRSILSALSIAALVSGCEGGFPADGGVRNSQESLLVAGATYSSLRDLENLFPIPNGQQDINVGTFDAATGQFTGLVSTVHYEIDPETRKPIPIRTPPSTDINAVGANLIFHVVNRGTQSFQVTVDGRTVVAAAGANSIEVDVLRAKSVLWSVHAGTHGYSDRLIINRPGVIGAGVFTIGALPISLLYEPPQTGAGLSSTAITTTETVGSSITSGTTTESSTSKPKFIGISAFIDKLSAVKSLLAFYHASSPVLNGVIDTVKGALGTWSQETVSGTSVSDENTLEISSSSSLSYSTNAGLGPGRGDRIIYLRDAQVAWVVVDGDISLALIGYAARAAYTVEQLKLDMASIDSGMAPATTVTGLDRDTLSALLGLDPFVTFRRVPFGGGPTLAAPRYVDQGVEEGDGPATFIEEHTVRETDRQANKSFNATTTEYKAGWLAALGIGPDSSTDKVSTTVSTMRSVTTSETVRAQLSIAANVGSPYHYHVYYDAVFGTFAVQNDDGGIVVNPLPPLMR